MAAVVLAFAPKRPEGRTCPNCDGHGSITAFVHGPDATLTFPCKKCEGTGWFTSLAHAEGEVRYWRSMLSTAHTTTQRRKASENLEFWTDKAAMYAAMRKAGL